MCVETHYLWFRSFSFFPSLLWCPSHFRQFGKMLINLRWTNILSLVGSCRYRACVVLCCPAGRCCCCVCWVLMCHRINIIGDKASSGICVWHRCPPVDSISRFFLGFVTRCTTWWESTKPGAFHKFIQHVWENTLKNNLFCEKKYLSIEKSLKTLFYGLFREQEHQSTRATSNGDFCSCT